MIRIHTSRRQDAKERRMYWRVFQHKGRVRVIARHVSYPQAVREVRECRALRPDCRFLYLQCTCDGYTVVELEARS